MQVASSIFHLFLVVFGRLVFYFDCCHLRFMFVFHLPSLPLAFFPWFNVLLPYTINIFLFHFLVYKIAHFWTELLYAFLISLRTA